MGIYVGRLVPWLLLRSPRQPNRTKEERMMTDCDAISQQSLDPLKWIIARLSISTFNSESSNKQFITGPVQADLTTSRVRNPD